MLVVVEVLEGAHGDIARREVITSEEYPVLLMAAKVKNNTNLHLALCHLLLDVNNLRARGHKSTVCSAPEVKAAEAVLAEVPKVLAFLGWALNAPPNQSDRGVRVQKLDFVLKELGPEHHVLDLECCMVGLGTHTAPHVVSAAKHFGGPVGNNQGEHGELVVLNIGPVGLDDLKESQAGVAGNHLPKENLAGGALKLRLVSSSHSNSAAAHLVHRDET